MSWGLVAEVKRAATTSGAARPPAHSTSICGWGSSSARHSGAPRRSRGRGRRRARKRRDSRLFDLRAGTPLRDVAATTPPCARRINPRPRLWLTLSVSRVLGLSWWCSVCEPPGFVVSRARVQVGCLFPRDRPRGEDPRVRPALPRGAVGQAPRCWIPEFTAPSQDGTSACLSRGQFL
jgi:hypothetical protein